MNGTAEATETKTADLPDPVVRRGITEFQWRTLFILFPGAKPESALMVWDYCKARQLDPMKKPCHIVPMRVKVNGEWGWRDVVMPGIYEYRTTAQRTGSYLGHSEPEYGPEIDLLGVKAPAWCAMTFYRWNEKAREKVPFPVKVWFAEVVATKEKDNREYVNERWTKAPIQMLTKCTEAAGLRESFPDEFGGEPTAEEMEGRRIEFDDVEVHTVQPPQPAQRKSQQPVAPAPPTPAAAPSVAPPSPEPPPEPAVAGSAGPSATTAGSGGPTVGVITDVREQSNGIGAIVLSTGYRCGTRNPVLIDAAKKHWAAKVTVELSAKPSTRPGLAPLLEEIVVVGDPQ
jgi:phage recombination protein Bet